MPHPWIGKTVTIRDREWIIEKELTYGNLFGLRLVEDRDDDRATFCVRTRLQLEPHMKETA